jgi:hypothetical protein
VTRVRPILPSLLPLLPLCALRVGMVECGGCQRQQHQQHCPAVHRAEHAERHGGEVRHRLWGLRLQRLLGGVLPLGGLLQRLPFRRLQAGHHVHGSDWYVPVVRAHCSIHTNDVLRPSLLPAALHCDNMDASALVDHALVRSRHSRSFTCPLCDARIAGGLAFCDAHGAFPQPWRSAPCCSPRRKAST